MQGTIVMLMALSGVGCHHKSCNWAPSAACYGGGYGACYGNNAPMNDTTYVAPSGYSACYSLCYSGSYTMGYGGCYGGGGWGGCYGGGCYGGGCYGGGGWGCYGGRRCGLFGGGGLFGGLFGWKNRGNHCSDLAYAAGGCSDGGAGRSPPPAQRA